MSVSVRDWLKLRLGGARDALSVMAAIGGGTLANPIFWNLPNPRLAGVAISAAGFASLTNRVLDVFSDRRAHSSDVVIRSNVEHELDDVFRVEDGVLLGYTVDRNKPVVVSWDDWMRHTFIVGQSGMGKTVLGEWIMFQQIARGGGLLWIDGKLDSENIQKLNVMAAWAGRRDQLEVINPGDPSMSNTYNPILDGDPDEVAARVLSLIPSTESNAGADFYRQKANQGMTTLVSAIQAARMAYSFGDIAILLQNEKALEHLNSLLEVQSDGGKQLALFMESLKTVDRQGQRVLDIKKINDLFGGLGGRMHSFGSGNFGQITGSYTPDVNLFDTVTKGRICYVALPTMGKAEAANNFGKMVIGDFRSAIARVQALPEKARPNPPFIGFFDEAGSYVTQAWSRMFEQARSARLVMIPAVQTIANLDAVSKELREMVIGNTRIKVCFGIGTSETAETFSELFGTELVGSTSAAIGAGASVNFTAGTLHRQGASESDNAGIGRKTEEVAKVTTNDLRSLGKGEAIVGIGDRIYHIKVPQVSFSRKLREEIGPFKVNRRKPQFARGLRLYEEAHRWIS